MIEIIAYYLPQYHAIPENDKWWSKGFTEWSNVAKAKPLFRGHNQPNIPADLGFYNLKNIDDQLAQIQLAKEAGVTAFCYWHYWFGENRLLLEKPINNVLNTPSLDFPFCFGWANESWQAKVWSSKGVSKGKVLIEQLYPGDEDIVNHFKYLKPFLEDSRYLRIEDKPVFVIYRPNQLPFPKHFIDMFNMLISESGIADGFYFIAHTLEDSEIESLKDLYDAVNIVRVGCYRFDKELIKKIPWALFKYKFLGRPLVLKYSKLIKYFTKDIDSDERVIPTIIPSWDHTPRSHNKGVVFYKTNPDAFGKHISNVLEKVKTKNNKIVFLKSWNEWGEGNYMEPDLRHGKSFVEKLKEVLRLYNY